MSGTRPESLFHSNLSALLSPVTAIIIHNYCMHTRQPSPLSLHGKLSPGTPASLTPVPICHHCLQLCHCLGTGLRRDRRGWGGFQRSCLGLWPQIARAICTTEQDAAHCGPKGTGLSSSSHLHCPFQRLADANWAVGEAASRLRDAYSEFSWLP